MFIRRHFLPVLLLTGVFLFSSLLLIGIAPIGGSSEAREAQVISVIQRTGEWILPLRNGIVPSKPPLYHWFGAALATLRGNTTPSVARAVSVLFSALTMILTAMLCYRLASFRSDHDLRIKENTPILTIIILWTSYLFVEITLAARVDMVFTFFSTAAVLPWIQKGDVTTKRISSLGIVLSGVLIGMAILSRGPLAIAFPILFILTLHLWIEGTSNLTRYIIHLVSALLIAILVAVPWYVLAFRQGGGSFFNRQIIFESINRIAGDEHMNSESFHFYILAFLRTLFPWSFIAIALAIKDIKNKPINRIFNREWKFRMMPLIWVCLGILCLSFASGKRPSYLVPLLPFWAVYISLSLSDWWQAHAEPYKEKLSQWVQILSISGAWILVILVFLLELNRSLPLWESKAIINDSRVWFASVSLHREIGLTILAIFAFIGVTFKKTLWGGIGWGIALVSIVHFGLGVKGHLKSFDWMASRIVSESGSNEISAIKEKWDEYLDPVFFYINKDIPILEPKNISSLRRGVYFGRPQVVEPLISKCEGNTEVTKIEELRTRLGIRNNSTGILLLNCY